MSRDVPVEISSLHNPRLKQLRKWSKDPAGPECPWLPVEHEKHVFDLARRRPAALLLVARSRWSAGHLPPAEEILVVTDRVFGSLSTLVTPQGLVAWFPKPAWRWEDLPGQVLYLEGLQDPGNLGTIVRAAAATGWGLVTAPGTVSLYNAKVVRASAAYLWKVPFRQHENPEPLAARAYRFLRSDPRAASSLFDVELAPPLAVIIGREGGPAREPTGAVSVAGFRIPMAPGVDSLNAAVAAALVMYEAYRRQDSPGGAKG
ncbi:MAG: hypothetical protein Kow00109_27190 [Acidobacteriota bacterium]